METFYYGFKKINGFLKCLKTCFKLFEKSMQILVRYLLQGSVENAILTLIWVGFLGVRFEVGVSGEEVSNITPPPPYLQVV